MGLADNRSMMTTKSGKFEVDVLTVIHSGLTGLVRSLL